ncbi:MAG: DUF3800 domain-containing protein [Brevundimonas sp.]
MTPVALKALTRGVFRYEQSDRRVLVLRAYFDDSGTHAESPVVVMAGLMAHEDSWSEIEADWAAALAEFGLPDMHMSHCENAQKAFSGWSRDRRDLAVVRFRSIILKHSALMVVATLARTVWDEALAIRPEMITVFDNPLDYCFNSCIGKVARTRRTDAKQMEPLVVTFDSREQSLDNWRGLAAGYKHNFPEKIAGFAFGSMKDVLPLQAADMVAYEAFVYECERQRLGHETTNPRSNFVALFGGLQHEGGYYTPDQLVKLTDQILHELGER